MNDNEIKYSVIDIGVNLAHKSFERNWKQIVKEAIDSGVEKMILIGTSIEMSKRCLEMCQEWYEESKCDNLYATVGVHPYEAQSWNNESLNDLRTMLKHPFVKAVGECGLDYHSSSSRNNSSRSQQIQAFRAQLQLAMESEMPLYLHERDAFDDFIHVIEEARGSSRLNTISSCGTLVPQMVVHCFSGDTDQAMYFLQRGFYLGISGIICKKDKGDDLSGLLSVLPTDKLMIETDAPFLGFKGRRPSRPSDCLDVARKMSEVKKIALEKICLETRLNAENFFNIKTISCKHAY